jgi:type III secretion protein V
LNSSVSKDQLSARYTQGLEILIVFLIAPEIEARVEAVVAGPGISGSEMPLDEALQQSLCDSAWKALRSAGPATPRAVILTATSVRAALREMIAPELPDLPVVAYSDLRPELTIQPIARLG